MTTRSRWVPLAWGLGAGAGCLVAALLGPYVPGWGVALAPAGATLVFAVGAIVVPEDESLAMVLRVTVALTLGFVATTVPVTLAWLAQGPERALELRLTLDTTSTEEAQERLTTMWLVMPSMVPVGAVALWARRRRAR